MERGPTKHVGVSARGRARPLWLVPLIAALLVACGGAPVATSTGAPAPSASAAPAATPTVAEQLADRQELRVGVSRNLVAGEKDPWFMHSSLMVWEPLIKLDEQLRPVPGLAESWSVSDDGLTWTLKLRPNVTFSDGEPFNADAVLANFAHLREASGRPSNFFSLNFAASYGNPARIEKADNLTIRIVHTQPLPTLPNSISNFFSAMFSPKSFAANGDFTGIPAAAGPFKLTQWAIDQGATLERNESYWGTKATLTRITIRIYPDANSRLSALRAGEVDTLLELGALQPAQGRELRADASLRVLGANSSCTTYINYNGTKAPFNDPKLRRAVDLALDREAIVRDLNYGFGTPARGVITAYTPDIRSTDPAAQITYNPAEAQRLAQEALQGQRAKAVVLFSPPTGRSSRPFPQIAAYLQASLKPLGLDIELKQLEATAASDASKAGQFDLLLGGGCFPNGDPDFILRRSLYSKAAWNVRGSGNGGYDNPEADRLLDEARVTLDPAARARLYDQLQRIAVRDVPFSPLYDEQEIVAWRPNVRGVGQSLIYQPSLDKIYLVK